MLWRRFLLTRHRRSLIAKEIGSVFTVRSIFAHIQILYGGRTWIHDLNNVKGIVDKTISATQVCSFSTIYGLSWDVRWSASTMRRSKLERLEVGLGRLFLSRLDKLTAFELRWGHHRILWRLARLALILPRISPHHIWRLIGWRKGGSREEWIKKFGVFVACGVIRGTWTKIIFYLSLPRMLVWWDGK